MKVLPTTTSILVSEIGSANNQYIIQMEKATINTPNTCGFDHRFEYADLIRLKHIAQSLGLNAIIEGNMIEFTDNTKLKKTISFSFLNFHKTLVEDNGYNAFCEKIQQVFTQKLVLR